MSLSHGTWNGSYEKARILLGVDPGVSIAAWKQVWQHAHPDIDITVCRLIWIDHSLLGIYSPQDEVASQVTQWIEQSWSHEGLQWIRVHSEHECEILHALHALSTLPTSSLPEVTWKEVDWGIPTKECGEWIDTFPKSTSTKTVLTDPELLHFIQWRSVDLPPPSGLYRAECYHNQLAQFALQLQYQQGKKLLSHFCPSPPTEEVPSPIQEEGEFLHQIPDKVAEDEIFTSLMPFLSSEQYRLTKLEKIVSTGQHSQEWYDQTEHEFVILIQGHAALEHQDGRIQTLCPGSWAYLPAHCPHRVFYTSAIHTTVWFAVFFEPQEIEQVACQADK